MQTETIFRILLPILIVSFVLHRGYYAKNRTQPDNVTLKKREEGLVSKFAGLLGLAGFIAMIVYVINPAWLARASLSLPFGLRWAGVGIAILGFILLQWSQNTLGKSWSDMPRMIKEQTLITTGPYRWIRHPIYTAFLLILGATLLISSNWVIGFSWLGMTILEITSRIKFEESLMLEYFGDQYLEYIKTTGRLLPRTIIQKI